MTAEVLVIKPLLRVAVFHHNRHAHKVHVNPVPRCPSLLWRGNAEAVTQWTKWPVMLGSQSAAPPHLSGSDIREVT